MKKFYFIFTIVAFIFFSNNVISQQIIDYRNADDILLKKKVAENPDIVNKYVIYEKEFKKLIDNIKENKDVRTDTLINGKRIIPVVFHIIHKGGAENITKAQILDAVEKINIDYAKMNADTANTYSIFKSRAADIKIELRLAQIDPWGNCTEGIDRVYDPQTNYGYFGTMHQYCWNPDKYMNIYAVNFIYPEGITLPEGAFIGGMSPFPPSNSLSSTLTGGDTLVDGVLIRQDCIGSIGTAVSLGGMPLNMLNRTFTHETGHYFNLYHPFQSLYAALGINGCGNFIITAGDEVSDTPPVAEATQNTSINCFTPGSRNTCSSTDAIYGIDAPDMIENYMDYQFGYCTNIFTLGQLERIDATLQSDRKNLWSKENLIATGVLNASPALCPPIADFYANRFMVCAGGEVTFTDYSYSGAAQDWLWTFDGGTPSTSTLQNPTVQYNTPGTYDVKLKVSNASGSDSLIKTSHIIVNDNSVSPANPFVESFETTTLSNGWIIRNDTGNTWQITDTAAYTGTKSLRLANFYNNKPGSYDELYSPAYSVSNLPVGTTDEMTFRYAYTGKAIAASIAASADTVYDALKIYFSKDCGATWTLKFNKSGAALSTANPVTTNYKPSSTSDWVEETINLATVLNSDNIRMKFEFHSNSGNNLYIDDINITKAQTSIANNLLLQDLQFNIQPNPVSDNTMISFNLSKSENVKLNVMNLLGQEMINVADGNLSAGQYKYVVNRADFGNAGFYIVKINVDGNIITKKIIVK